MKIILLIGLILIAGTITTSESPNSSNSRSPSPLIALSALSPQVEKVFACNQKLSQSPIPESLLLKLNPQISNFQQAQTDLESLSPTITHQKYKIVEHTFAHKDHVIKFTAAATLLAGGATLVISQKSADRRMIPFWSIGPALSAGGIFAGIVGSLALLWNWRVSQAGRREAEKIAEKNLQRLREIQETMNGALQAMRRDIADFESRTEEARAEDKDRHRAQVTQLKTIVQNSHAALKTTFQGVIEALADAQGDVSALREGHERLRAGLAHALETVDQLQRGVGVIHSTSAKTLEEIQRALNPEAAAPKRHIFYPFRRGKSRSASSVPQTTELTPPLSRTPSATQLNPRDFDSHGASGAGTADLQPLSRPTVQRPAPRSLDVLASVPFNSPEELSEESSNNPALGAGATHTG